MSVAPLFRSQYINTAFSSKTINLSVRGNNVGICSYVIDLIYFVICQRKSGYMERSNIFCFTSVCNTQNSEPLYRSLNTKNRILLPPWTLIYIYMPWILSLSLFIDIVCRSICSPSVYIIPPLWHHVWWKITFQNILHWNTLLFYHEIYIRNMLQFWARNNHSYNMVKLEIYRFIVHTMYQRPLPFSVALSLIACVCNSEYTQIYLSY